MNKPESPLDAIESAEERTNCLKEYPYTGDERQEGRVYLTDYYDSEAIEIDKLLYLGLTHRPVLIWLRDEEKEKKRCREYLKIAFDMFVKKTEKEDIHTFAEYDQRFSIHYFCSEWIEKLLDLLRDNDDRELKERVKSCYEEMHRFAGGMHSRK